MSERSAALVVRLAARDDDASPSPRAMHLRAHTRTVLLLLGCVALAAATALYRIGDRSFWLDEAFSVSVARGSWSHVWQIVSEHEANMGVYYFLLHVWLAFGEGEAAVRALSAVFAVAAVAVLFFLVQRLFGTPAAVLASFLLATNALFVEHAQNARGYSMAVFALVLCTYAFVRAVEQPSSPRWWVAYAVFATLAVYSHFYAVLVIGAHVAVLPFSPTRRRLRPAAVVYGLVATLAIPLALFSVVRDRGQVDWIPPPGVFLAFDTWFTLAGASRFWFTPTLIALAGAFVSLVAIAGAVSLAVRSAARRAPDAWKHALLAGWVVVPIVSSFLLSFAKPVFLPRYFVVVTPALAAAVAVFLLQMPRRRVAIALAGVLLAASTANLGLFHRYGGRDHENWRGVVEHVYERQRAGDAIVFFDPYVSIAFDHYAERDYAGRLGPTRPFRYRGTGFTGTMLPSHWGPLRTSTAPRLWLVLSHNLDDQRETRRIRSMLEGRHDRVSRRYFAGVRVELYRRS